MTPDQLQQQIDRLTEKKAQAEKEAATGQVMAEQKAKRELAAEALRADRAAKLAELFATKIDKAARQLEERYGFAMKSYAALQELLDEARSAGRRQPPGTGRIGSHRAYRCQPLETWRVGDVPPSWDPHRS
jgi:hypothetical protein